ncbi:MAG TPA: redoxin family protein [Candidatus Limnocylindrales bacterium]
MALILLSLSWLAACGSTAPQAPPSSPSPGTVAPVGSPTAGSATAAAARPAWFDIRMTDVLTGQTFAMNDFAGKVVLVEAMAEWCPTCIEQQREVQKLHDLLASSSEVVSVSLDIDVHEDAPSLKHYATSLGHAWHYAVAPLEVARALGNLYSAEYLNPPFSPMLLIDRGGVATSLPYGVKTADYLRATVEPLLTP